MATLPTTPPNGTFYTFISFPTSTVTVSAGALIIGVGGGAGSPIVSYITLTIDGAAASTGGATLTYEAGANTWYMRGTGVGWV